MAHYFITHTCGHEETVNLLGKSEDRKRKEAWLNSIPCRECARKEFIEANGTATLEGSPKQIAWAEDLRARYIDILKARIQRIQSNTAFATAEQTEQRLHEEQILLDRVTAETSAKVIIDNRLSLDHYYYTQAHA